LWHSLVGAAQLIASAANRGQQDIHDTAQKWLVGLGNIEKLLTALRVARGTKKQALKTQQLADSAELFGAIEAFLVSVGLKPAISFRLQVVRSKVLEGCFSQKNLSGPVDSAAAKMAKIFKDIAAESAAAATSSGHVDSQFRWVFLLRSHFGSSRFRASIRSFPVVLCRFSAGTLVAMVLPTKQAAPSAAPAAKAPASTTAGRPQRRRTSRSRTPPPTRMISRARVERPQPCQSRRTAPGVNVSCYCKR